MPQPSKMINYISQGLRLEWIYCKMFPHDAKIHENTQDEHRHTPWKFNIAPENKPSQKERIIFQPSFFRGHVKLRGCILYVYIHSTLQRMSEGIRKCLLLLTFASFFDDIYSNAIWDSNSLGRINTYQQVPTYLVHLANCPQTQSTVPSKGPNPWTPENSLRIHEGMVSGKTHRSKKSQVPRCVFSV